MPASRSSKLDTEKFRKVHGLMTGGATEGERSAGKSRAEAMAAKADMTIAEAVSSLNTTQADPTPANFFEGFDDWCEEREPGYKAKRAAAKDERDAADARLREKALAEYGSEDAVWAESERERLLRETLEPLADWGRYADWGASPGGAYITGYAGWRVGRPTAPLLEALHRAYPFPYDLPGLWRERQEWERLYTYRHAFETHYDFPEHVRARIAGLEFNLDTLSDPTFEGFDARLAWMKFRAERDISSDVHDDLSMIATMRADLAMLRATHGAKGSPSSGGPSSRPKPWGGETPPHHSKGSAQSAYPRTNSEKRAAVLSMLDAHPELSDREIGRRLKISPQTVNSWRKRR